VTLQESGRITRPDNGAGANRTPLRLLTLSTLFPNARQPRHGIFVANRLARLRDSGRVQASVVAAVPWFPAMYREYAAVPRRETLLGFDVRHPRYLHVPGLGMRMQPDSLARALLQELRRCRMDAASFDLVDAHYFYPDGVAAARIADELGLPLVISARGSDINRIGEIPFARDRMLQAAHRAEALIAVSVALGAKMASMGMPAENIHVLRNGVDSTMFLPAPRAEARALLGLAENDRCVLGVGNLVPEKGFDLLIRAVSSLAEVRLLIVGEGPLRRELRALADQLAPGRVEFRDNVPQPELRHVYSACDVLGVPSLREGWPNVVLEAMACGIPVVASAVGGLPEIVLPDAPSRLVEERSAVAWEQALRSLLESPPSPATVRDYALGFGWDEVVSRQIDLYDAVVRSRSIARAR